MAIPPFQTFLEEQRAPVYRFLVAAVGSQEADDCFQETFLAALRAYPRLRNGDHLRSWILTIATRKAIDAGRSRARRPMTVDDRERAAEAGDTSGATGVAGADPQDPGPIDLEDPLWRAVRTLPSKQRAAVVHRYVLDRSYAEVGEVMGISEESARANVYQAMKRLRLELNDEAHA